MFKHRCDRFLSRSRLRAHGTQCNSCILVSILSGRAHEKVGTPSTHKHLSLLLRKEWDGFAYRLLKNGNAPSVNLLDRTKQYRSLHFSANKENGRLNDIQYASLFYATGSSKSDKAGNASPNSSSYNRYDLKYHAHNFCLSYNTAVSPLAKKRSMR